MRVAVFVTNAPGVYGGGRLAAFVLAQCLARAGVEVCLVTNHRPVFFEELRDLGRPGRVETWLTPDFLGNLPPGRFDLVLLFPTRAHGRAVSAGARGFARRRGARLALFNFETPDWFNALSPVPRDEAEWEEWRRVAAEEAGRGLLILSNSRESERHARGWFADPRLSHDHWHQPVNLDALARVAPQYRERRIVAFARPRDAHKGGEDLIAVLDEALRGWTLSVIVGAEELETGFRDRLVLAARRHGIEVEIHPLADETRKFVELRRARMLLYPSRFEGYGIPPIEALAAGTPCVCYDLPVLREVCGEALVAVPPGDVGALRAAVLRVAAADPGAWEHLPAAVASVGSVEGCGRAARASLERFLATPPPAAAPPPAWPDPLPERPAPRLLHLLPPALHPGALLELRGWAVLPPGGRVLLRADGVPLGEARPAPALPGVPPGTGFALLRPHRPLEGEMAVEALALGPDGAVLDHAAWTLPPEAALRPPAPPGGVWHVGPLRGWREAEGAVVAGWLLADPPATALEAFAGPCRLWCQGGGEVGFERPDLLARHPGLPPQAPGFAVHLGRRESWMLEAAGALTLVAHGPAGPACWRLPLDLAPLPPGRPEPEEPAGDPAALPALLGIDRAERDSYGVIELEGWVLARPRVTALRVRLGETVLGETLPDRLRLGIHARHREYGDAYGGFALQARVPGGEGDSLRVEALRGAAVVQVAEVPLAPLRRNAGPWGTTLARLPDGLLADPARPATLAVIGDAGPLDPLRGAADRALLAELRRRAPLLLLLHGNPQGFAAGFDRWEALAEGVLLLNDLHPGPDALAATLAALAAEPGLGPVLRREAAGRWSGPSGPLETGPDGAGVLAALDLPGAPRPAGEGPWLVLDATLAPPGALAAALAGADGAGAAPLVVVEAPPLEPEAALRARLGLPARVALAWPGTVARLDPAALRGVLDLGPPGGASPVGLALAARGVPVGATAEGGPWPRATLAALAAGTVPATRPPARPYAALDGLLPG